MIFIDPREDLVNDAHEAHDRFSKDPSNHAKYMVMVRSREIRDTHIVAEHAGGHRYSLGQDLFNLWGQCLPCQWTGKRFTRDTVRLTRRDYVEHVRSFNDQKGL